MAVVFVAVVVVAVVVFFEPQDAMRARNSSSMSHIRHYANYCSPEPAIVLIHI